MAKLDKIINIKIILSIDRILLPIKTKSISYEDFICIFSRRI